MDLRTVFIVWLVTSFSLYFFDKIPSIGVEVDTPKEAFTSAVVIGIITAVVRPILRLTFAALNVVTFDFLTSVLTFVISVLCFGLAASLVQGFRLRFGIWSAVIGAGVLSAINSLMYGFLTTERQ